MTNHDFFVKLGQVKPEAELGFDATVRGYFNYNAELLLSKHSDYGPRNIADSPGGPINGLRVRLHDKMARINHLVDNQQDAVNEPLRDSFMDLANYAMIGLLVLDGKWPEE